MLFSLVSRYYLYPLPFSRQIPAKGNNIIGCPSHGNGHPCHLDPVNGSEHIGDDDPDGQVHQVGRRKRRHIPGSPQKTVCGGLKADEGIEEGDILVIDKSLELQDDDLAVCFIDGDFTVKRVRIEPNAVWLIPANPKYSLIKVTKENEFIVWGIVTYTIKKNRRKR